MVMLRVVAGLDVAAVAELVGKKPGAVRVAVHRALKSLARSWAADHGNDSDEDTDNKAERWCEMTERPGDRDDLADDLAAWADDDLVRASARPAPPPSSPTQEQYVAAFREAGGSSVRSLPRRAAGPVRRGRDGRGRHRRPHQRRGGGVHRSPAGSRPGGRPLRDRRSGSRHRGPAPCLRSTVAGAAPFDPAEYAVDRSVGLHLAAGTLEPGHVRRPAPGPRSRHGDDAPSDTPTSGASSPPTTSSSGSAAAMTMSAPTHRVGPRSDAGAVRAGHGRHRYAAARTHGGAAGPGAAALAARPRDDDRHRRTRLGHHPSRDPDRPLPLARRSRRRQHPLAGAHGPCPVADRRHRRRPDHVDPDEPGHARG